MVGGIGGGDGVVNVTIQGAVVCERGFAQMQRGADVEVVVQTSLEHAGRVSIGVGHFGYDGCTTGSAAGCWYSVMLAGSVMGSDCCTPRPLSSELYNDGLLHAGGL